MSFAEIQKLKELLKTLQGSGEATTRIRMEVGRAIEKIQKKRSAAKMMAGADVSLPLGLLESSFEKSSLLGERWKPPWDPAWNPLSNEEFLNAPKILNPRAFDINLHRGASHALTELESPGGRYFGLNERTKNILAKKLNYRMKLEESYAGAIRGGDPIGAKAIAKKIETLDDSIYRMGATEWDTAKDIPEEWKDTLKAYSKRDLFEEMSGPYFTGGYIPGDLGSNLLSFKDPKNILNKAAIFTQKQWQDREAAQQELQFINNYLSNPQTAKEYAKNAPLSFFKYWSEKGGMSGLQEHMRALKAAARSEDEELFKTKWGALTTVKDLKTRNFAFASLRGKVTQLWDPTSPKISQVGLFQDATGEKIKFTIWNNQQQNVQKVEVGKNYYFGNVASQEWQGRWNLNINSHSVIEEIKPMPFDTAPPLIVPRSKVELRDYSKPYSINPMKGTITYTTKSGRVVEMPIQEADMTSLKNIRIGDERGDMAAFLPFAGIPFFQGGITGGTAQIGSQHAAGRNAGERILETLGGAYDDISTLGSIWYQKASEANERIKARDAAAPGAESGNFSLAWANTKYQMTQLPWNVLDVLGGALYPLSYPGQALWGELSGIGAMEGIHNEISPADVLGIENPAASLAADIAGDPLTWIGTGAFTRGERLLRTMRFEGLRNMLADESAILGRATDKTLWKKAGMPRTEFVEKAAGKGLPEDGLMVEAGMNAKTQKAIDEKKLPWATLLLGAGVGAAATASLFSLPQKKQEVGREQVREALKPSEKPGVLETTVDIMSTDSYLEGAALMDLKAWLTGGTKRYGWEDRITPSIALGIKDEDTGFFSLRGLAGTALDIVVAPTTYLSLGSGAAVKIGSVGGKGAKALKLSKTGVKELATFTKKYGEEMGTLEFAHHMEQNQAFQKKVLAAGGVNLRGWGKEVNLIPGSVFDPVANAAKESAMQFSLEHPAAFKKVVGVQEYLENKFVVRAAAKRLPRSSRLLPMEADYAEKAMLLPKKIRFDIAQGTERDIQLAKEARKAFGENYEEIVSDLIETPVMRESAKLTREQQAIIEELETFNKGFAIQEKELELLDTEMSGYLRHTMTQETKKYLEKGGRKVSTELYTPLSVENKFGTKRTIKGTVARINEQARKELGIDFDYFESNPFKATSIRRAESVKAVEQAKLLKWTVEKYGVPEEVARAQPDKYVQSSVEYIKGSWLPKPIAEDIEKEFVKKDTGTVLQLYDKALNAWKYSATVTHPAYHASNVVSGIFNNWLAEVDPISYYRSSRLLLGGDKEKVFTTALGEEYSGQELLKMAGESGILSQPGMMDIQKLSYEIADTQKEKAIELAKKGANAPITAAQYEENFIRLSLFNDRIMKGDTIQGARAWVSEFQFQYSKESFTPFERDYMKRMVPFYAWMRGNIPLQTRQMLYNPGKYAQFGKLTNAAVGGQELPQYTEGDLAWMWQRDESTGTFNYMRTPATDLDIFNDPLWYSVGAITPFAKYPAEEVLGFNTYTLKDFDPGMPWYNPQHSASSNLIVGRTGRDAGTLSDVYEDRNSGKQAAKYLAGVGQASTKTRKKSDMELRDVYRKYTGRPNDFTYEQRLALMQRDNWASAQSGISGEFEQLQGGHFYPAELGGAALPWNYITQTREENYEWRSAQNYIENLPERELQREEAWGRYEAEYAAGVDEINTRTLDTRGRPENEAQKENKRYDLRKSANIKMYNRQLNTVRAAIRSAEKDLRGEKKKVEDARAKGYSDPASEEQIKVIEAVLAEYRALYEKVSGLRDAEQGKEFELPVQGTDLSRFQPMDIGSYEKYAVRYGKGPELAKPEDIEKLVDLKKITAYYAAMKSYGPIVGFMPGTPEEVQNRILITRDPRYAELAQIANPLISGAGWEGISGKNYIGPRNISEIRAVVEGSVSEPEPVIGTGEPPKWYSDQQASQEPAQTTGFDYNDPEFREVVREIVQETLSEGIVSD